MGKTKMTHRTVDYASLIRNSGHRLTPQRELILDAVCAGGGHTTFDEVYRYIQTRFPSIDRSTVYRSLDFLCQMELITSSEIDGDRVYEIAAGSPPHHHLICRSCGAEAQVGHESVTNLFDAIEQEYHFTVDTNHLILYGLCEECRHKQTAAERSA